MNKIQLQPSNFTIVIEEGNNPSDNEFIGSSTGTDIQLEPGPYRVSEEGLDPITPAICNSIGFDRGRDTSDIGGNNLFICTNFSDGCEGEITLGNSQTCTIENVLVEQNVFGDNVYVVWPDNTDNTFGKSEIWFAFSTNKGESFSDSKNISQTSEGSNLPQISAQGDDVYVVWQDNTLEDTNNFDIFFKVSHDGGQTFSSIQNLSNTTGFSSKPQISSYGNNVYVVWQEGFFGQDVFFNVSHDRGDTFEEIPENLSNTPGSSVEPQISSSGNNVSIVWQDSTPIPSDIFFKVSHDVGETFNDIPQNISDNIGDSIEPQISSSGDNVYIVWQDSTDDINNYEVLFRASNDGGETFGDIQNLSNTPLVSSGGHQISSSGNNVYVVWFEGIFPNFDIFIRASNDGGETFGDIQNLSNNPEFSSTPQISSFGKRSM